MVTYTFECPDDDWDEWKGTFPNNKNVDERLRELIRADTEEEL